MEDLRWLVGNQVGTLIYVGWNRGTQEDTHGNSPIELFVGCFLYTCCFMLFLGGDGGCSGQNCNQAVRKRVKDTRWTAASSSIWVLNRINNQENRIKLQHSIHRSSSNRIIFISHFRCFIPLNCPWFVTSFGRALPVHRHRSRAAGLDRYFGIWSVVLLIKNCDFTNESWKIMGQLGIKLI